MAKLNYDRNAKAAQRSIGRAVDGVVILRPVARPKHFTQSQIEKTVDEVRRRSGGLATRKRGSAETLPKAPTSK